MSCLFYVQWMLALTFPKPVRVIVKRFILILGTVMMFLISSLAQDSLAVLSDNYMGTPPGYFKACSG